MKNKLTLLLIVVLIASTVNALGTSKLFSKILPEVCFNVVNIMFDQPEKTPLDDANCNLQDIDEANALVIYPILQHLVVRLTIVSTLTCVENRFLQNL
jgi:hypothetical protein